jgi:hypothetical protein
MSAPPPHTQEADAVTDTQKLLNAAGWITAALLLAAVLLEGMR